jgi:hypothetical protein
MHNIPRITTISAARVAVGSIEASGRKAYDVMALQDYHKHIPAGKEAAVGI